MKTRNKGMRKSTKKIHLLSQNPKSQPPLQHPQYQPTSPRLRTCHSLKTWSKTIVMLSITWTSSGKTPLPLSHISLKYWAGSLMTINTWNLFSKKQLIWKKVKQEFTTQSSSWLNKSLCLAWNGAMTSGKQLSSTLKKSMRWVVGLTTVRTGTVLQNEFLSS